jgi:hypothetical protein
MTNEADYISARPDDPLVDCAEERRPVIEENFHARPVSPNAMKGVFGSPRRHDSASQWKREFLMNLAAEI